jgi:hypothetical protein
MSGEPACTLAGFADITEEIAGHGRGVDYSIAQVERLSAFFIMLIGFEWVRPRLAPGTRATFELRHYSIFPQRLAAMIRGQLAEGVPASTASGHFRRHPSYRCAAGISVAFFICSDPAASGTFWQPAVDRSVVQAVGRTSVRRTHQRSMT